MPISLSAVCRSCSALFCKRTGNAARIASFLFSRHRSQMEIQTARDTPRCKHRTAVLHPLSNLLTPLPPARPSIPASVHQRAAMRPTKSGCAQIKASCSSEDAADSVFNNAACKSWREANGRQFHVRSAIHGECSKNGPHTRTKSD